MSQALKFGFTAQQIIDEGRITKEDIDVLKTWLATQKYPEISDEQLVLFLLSCGNEQEPTKTTIEAFYSVKNGTPDVFDNRNIQRDDLQKQLKTGQFCVFPERTDDGCVIIFYRFCDTYYYNFEFGPFLTLLFMTLDAALYDHPPKGLIMLFDIKGMGLMHLTRLRLGYLRTYFQYLQEGLPVKLKNIHVLNSVYFIDKIMRLIRPFANQSVLDGMHFHPSSMDMEWFYKNWLPKRCLPEDLGGNLPSIGDLHQQNIQKLTDLQPHFEEEQLQRHASSIS